MDDKKNYEAKREVTFIDIEKPSSGNDEDGGHDNDEGKLKVNYPDSNKVYMYKQTNSYPKLALGSSDDSSRFTITFTDGSKINEKSFKLYFGTSKSKGVELKSGSDYILDIAKNKETLYASIKDRKSTRLNSSHSV